MYITNFVYVHTNDDENNIILNSLTGAIDIVTSKVAKILKDKDNKLLDEIDPKVLQKLFSRGYIYKDQTEEDRKRMVVYQNYLDRSSNMGYTFAFYPTYGSNFDCVYSFGGDLLKKNQLLREEILLSSFTYIKSVLDKYPDQDHKIDLYSGEPLSPEHQKNIEKILDFAQREQLSVDIITIGSNVSYLMPILTKYKIIESIQISINRPKEKYDQFCRTNSGEDTYDLIFQKVKEILENDINVNVRINIDKNNINHLEELIEYFEWEGLVLYNNFSVYFIPAHSMHGENEYNISEADIVEKLAKTLSGDNSTKGLYTLAGIKVLAHATSILEDDLTVTPPPLFHYCNAAQGKYISFGSDGKCYPCAHVIGNEKLALGSFHPEINMEEEKTKLPKKSNIFGLEKCVNCAIGLFCGGGCPFDISSNSGSLIQSNVCENSYNDLKNYLDNYKKRRGLLC